MQSQSTDTPPAANTKQDAPSASKDEQLAPAVHSVKGQSKTAPKPKKQPYPDLPDSYPWGVKKWLSRKELWWEYGWCARTVRRLEKRGQLLPSILLRHRRYKRADVEACLERSGSRSETQPF